MNKTIFLFFLKKYKMYEVLRIAVSQLSRYCKEGRFSMRFDKLIYWNDVSLLHFNEEQVGGANDQDGGANEQDHNQHVGANKQNVDPDGDANEQNADREGDANEQNADQDGDANEQNADQDGDANDQIINYTPGVITFPALVDSAS
ncbi:uncharacterized protein LOC132049505 [Lycium ferocissimum]|uniref:uncharacterized protein LOC132049505 n=1 Tax=Lycium ferocissimum TaxID=112874 RepID=UPI002816219B|nr:uncharacterized protein LOC132049505 [Lycium ferocissimum]